MIEWQIDACFLANQEVMQNQSKFELVSMLNWKSLYQKDWMCRKQ